MQAGRFNTEEEVLHYVLDPFPWLLMTPPSSATGKLLLKVCCFVLLPCHMVFLRFLHPTSVLQSMTLIPPSMGIPTVGALLHNSVGEQLSVALFANAIVLYCARDPAVCMLSVAMTALSSVAVVVKKSTLRASFEASKAKAETTQRQECEIEGDNSTLPRLLVACAYTHCLRNGCTLLLLIDE